MHVFQFTEPPHCTPALYPNDEPMAMADAPSFGLGVFIVHLLITRGCPRRLPAFSRRPRGGVVGSRPPYAQSLDILEPRAALKLLHTHCKVRRCPHYLAVQGLAHSVPLRRQSVQNLHETMPSLPTRPRCTHLSAHKRRRQTRNISGSCLLWSHQVQQVMARIERVLQGGKASSRSPANNPRLRAQPPQHVFQRFQDQAAQYQHGRKSTNTATGTMIYIGTQPSDRSRRSRPAASKPPTAGLSSISSSSKRKSHTSRLGLRAVSSCRSSRLSADRRRLGMGGATA
jgi:hypothetical protein